MKKCNKCEKEKPFSSFHKMSRSSDGVRASCKKCVNKQNKSWRDSRKKPEKISKFQNSLPDHSYLIENFTYHESGNLACVKPRGNLASGDFLAKNSNEPYKRCAVLGNHYLLHRLIYKHQTGDEPEFIDHIDGDKHNNRIENLRPCTKSQNRANSKLHAKNKSGFTGVYKYKDKWRVSYKGEGGKATTKLFCDLSDAIAFRVEFVDKEYGDFSKRQIERGRRSKTASDLHHYNQ